MSEPSRDDSAFAFSEPYPLHGAFDMPPPRATRPEFVHRSVCQRVIDSFGQSDSEFAAAIGALQDALDGGANRNSGAAAPIQGQG
jgi:hypothetical protein